MVHSVELQATWSLCNGVWLTHSDIIKVKVISELLCVRHSYVNLECFNSEDIDFIIEFLSLLGSSVVERRSLTGELSLVCT